MGTPVMSTVRERVSWLRSVSGLSQAEFASRVGVCRATITKLERDDRQLGANVAKRFARSCGVSVEWLLMGGSLSQSAIKRVRAALCPAPAILSSTGTEG